tara:strand:- start:3551 stop:3931 length:381 start_codon:yes stop_codon:yes gene_type:complete
MEGHTMKKLLTIAAFAALTLSSTIANAGCEEGGCVYVNWKSDSVNVMHEGKLVGKLNYQIDEAVINNDDFQNWAGAKTSEIYQKAKLVTNDDNYVSMVMPGELHMAASKVYGNNDIRIRYGEFNKL